MKENDYEVFGVSLENVRNRHERIIIEVMKEMIPQFHDFDYCSICVQDVYALCLNQILPKYVQQGSIILKKEYSNEDYHDIVEAAIEQVSKNKNHPV